MQRRTYKFSYLANQSRILQFYLSTFKVSKFHPEYLIPEVLQLLKSSLDYTYQQIQHIVNTEPQTQTQTQTQTHARPQPQTQPQPLTQTQA